MLFLRSNFKKYEMNQKMWSQESGAAGTEQLPVLIYTINYTINYRDPAPPALPRKWQAPPKRFRFKLLPQEDRR